MYASALVHGVGKDLEIEYHLRRAIDLNAGDAWARVYLAYYLCRRGETVLAIDELKIAIAAAPETGFPHWSLASVYERQGDLAQARVCYEQALEIEPDDIVANTKFGRMLKKIGDKELARKYLRHGLFLDPNDQETRKLLEQMSE